MDQVVNNMDYRLLNQLNQFLKTHDIDLVKQFFTNTVLTPTETAQILAKANLNAHQISSQAQKTHKTTLSVNN